MALCSQFEVKSRQTIDCYSFEPVNASLEDLLLLDKVRTMFDTMRLTADPMQALKLRQSLGAWNQIIKFLSQTECIHLQLGSRFFYEIVIGRSHTSL